MSVVEINHLEKRFGKKAVLQDVHLQVEQGSILGLVGVNGAGKTTLLHTVLGLLKPDAGESTVFGEPSWDLSPAAKGRIGFVLQKFDAFEWMRVRQLLDFSRAFYSDWDTQKAEQLRAMWDLDPKARVRNLSEGQKQRLAIVQALSHNPDLLILDEPVASLDPQARRLFIRQLIEMNAEEEKTIVFSTHIISDLERVAAKIALMKNGGIYYHGDIDNLREQVARIRLYGNEAMPVQLSKTEHPYILRYTAADNAGQLTVQGDVADICSRLKKQFNCEVQCELLSLEEIFLELCA